MKPKQIGDTVMLKSNPPKDVCDNWAISDEHIKWVRGRLGVVCKTGSRYISIDFFGEEFKPDMTNTWGYPNEMILF